MGNRHSRVAPSRPFKILDSQTRARYKNQHELLRLNGKLRQINTEKNEIISRLTFDQHSTKSRLHELQHESGQRKFFKRINKLNNQSSVSSMTESDLSDESTESLSDNPSLLLHNFYASTEWERSTYIPGQEHITTTTTRKLPTVFDALQSRYSSKLDKTHNLLDHTESLLLSEHLSLPQLTEVMKKSIKISVARAARDSHAAARRKMQSY